MHKPKCTKAKSLSWEDQVKLGKPGRDVCLSTAVQRRGQFEFGDHEIHLMLPTLKVHVAGQGTQVIEEGFANPEFGAQQFVFGIYQT